MSTVLSLGAPGKGVCSQNCSWKWGLVTFDSDVQEPVDTGFLSYPLWPLSFLWVLLCCGQQLPVPAMLPPGTSPHEGPALEVLC